MLIESLRRAREMVGPLGSSDNPEPATIFVGLFNAVPYLQSLREQLLSQTTSLPMVVVDNASTDDTWALIQSWKSDFGGRLRLVRNSVNLGGFGSLYLNLDQLKTDWVITIHQDDLYKANHSSVLLKAIEAANQKVICISTEMGSLSSTGSKKSTPPRASWFLPDAEPETIFLSNIRAHNIPFPAAAFRVSALESNRIPWHSTAFPDTEWVLRHATNGIFQFEEQQTMFYRENPKSESHTVKTDEKNLASALALLRVFGADSFIDLCNAIATVDRSNFAAHLLEGIEIRANGSPFKYLLVSFASEQMLLAWDYSDPSLIARVANQYSEIGGEFPARLLRDLYNIGSDSELQLAPQMRVERMSTLVTDDPAEHDPAWRTSLVLGCYGRLPVRVRRLIAKRVAQSGFLRLRNKIWNFRWK